MTNWILISPLLLLLASLLIASETQALLYDDDNPYHHFETLDPDGKYKLEWLVDWDKETVFFNVTVKTKGFILFGISRRNPSRIEVNRADVIIGGVDSSGRSYFSDRHIITEKNSITPILDDKQDWILQSFWERRNKTFLSFSRAFSTCDPEDIVINEDSVNLIWAYGKEDPVSKGEISYAASGHVPMYLLDPDLTPRTIQQRNLSDPVAQRSGSEVKIWNLLERFTIPAKRTTYQCNIHKFTLPGKHHVVGLTFKINEEARPYVHHAVLMRCTISNAAGVFEKFVNQPGEECYTPDQQLGAIPFQSCIEVVAGPIMFQSGRPIFLPEVMGIPIGTTGEAEYFALQIHYDNPTGRAGMKAVTELNVHYTADLRPHDGGLLSIGHNYPGSPSLLLPPHSLNHRIYGHCSPMCTRRMLPPHGIKIVAAILHAHDAARRVTVQHFRNNKELPHILKDDNYRFDFTPARYLPSEVTVLPGDQITTRCHYDTTYSNRTIVGGYGRDQEMCKTFVFYYNQLTEHTGLCRSELISPEYTSRYLGGTKEVGWAQSQLEFVATEPAQLAGMTLSEISDSRFVNWSKEQRGKLQRDHILHPQMNICPSIKEYEVQLRTGISPPATYVRNPVEANQHVPEQKCSLL